MQDTILAFEHMRAVIECNNDDSNKKASLAQVREKVRLDTPGTSFLLRCLLFVGC